MEGAWIVPVEAVCRMGHMVAGASTAASCSSHHHWEAECTIEAGCPRLQISFSKHPHKLAAQGYCRVRQFHRCRGLLVGNPQTGIPVRVATS
jgi:hypothetical protein